ncbi:hypothetical protein BC827DRAFT_953591 [Russula dissimulans]|nr:hypothetical protein BC827DRAFT_953591 [Russula dissimulans]
MWAVASILADVLIAIGMTMIFRQARVSAGRFTNSALLRLVRLTVETNALTTAVAFLALMLYITHPNEIYYTFPIGIIGKMYSNTLGPWRGQRSRCGIQPVLHPDRRTRYPSQAAVFSKDDNRRRF